MKKLWAALLCAGMLSFVMTAKAEAQESQPMIYLENVTAYSVIREETKVTVPVYAKGNVDLQSYRMTVTYDSDVLQLQEMKGFLAEDAMEELSDAAGADGSTACIIADDRLHETIRFAGVRTEESAQKTNGMIGELTFLVKAKLRKDGVRTEVGLQLEELGKTTPVEDAQVGDATVVLRKEEAPKPFLYGDVDEDNTVSAADALQVLKYVVRLLSPQEEALRAADVDTEAGISAADALCILKKVVKLIERFPIEELPDTTLRAAVPGVQGEGLTNGLPPVLDIGDVDDDGIYTTKDALEVLRMALGLQEGSKEQKKTADINCNGVLEQQDVWLLLRAAMGEYTNFGYEDPGKERLIYVDARSYTRGNYCFRTLAEAVEYVNANPPAAEEERIILQFAPGTYREYTVLRAPYITYEPMLPEIADTEQGRVNLTFYYGCGNTYHSVNGGQKEAGAGEASTVIDTAAHDFIARNLMFENSYNIYITDEEWHDYCDTNNFSVRDREENIRKSTYQTQGLALRVDGDRSCLYNCRIIGRQDTLLMNAYNRVYFENCYIEGTVDFIYGNGTAVFERCTINSPYHAGHITAPSTVATQPYGFLFKDCVLTREATTESEAPLESSYSLGRPWNQPGMVVYFNCRMDRHITPGEDRFVNMGGNNGFQKQNARFFEYGTMDLLGNALDLSAITPDYETILTSEQMRTTYAPYRFLEAKYDSKSHALAPADGWNPGGYDRTATAE